MVNPIVRPSVMPAVMPAVGNMVVPTVAYVKLTTAEATAAGWTWNEGSDGEITLTGVPTLSEPTDVRIPDYIDDKPVTTIGDSGIGEMWRGDTNITGVTSLMLTTLGGNTFYGCTSLVSADLPKLTTVTDDVFYNCSSLASVKFLNLTTAGVSTFYNCTSLASVYLPNLTTEGGNFLRSCTSLVSVSLLNLTTVGNYSFRGCTSLESVSLLSLDSLGSSVFDGCSVLETLYLGAYPSSTGGYTFDNANADAVVYYEPDDTNFDAYWPDGTATENNPNARPAYADPGR